MLRFVSYALPLLFLLLALFGFAVEVLDVEPRSGSVIKLALFEAPRIPAQLVLGSWLVEASGLLAMFLLAQGRCGAWWLDGLVAGWLAWIFRGPLLVVTIVVAARQPHHGWWTIAFGWWVLYSICGLSLSILARRTELDLAVGASGSQRRHQALAQEVSTQEAVTEETVTHETASSESATPDADEHISEEPAPDMHQQAEDEATTSPESVNSSGAAEERQSPWAEPLDDDVGKQER